MVLSYSIRINKWVHNVYGHGDNKLAAFLFDSYYNISFISNKTIFYIIISATAQNYESIQEKHILWICNQKFH